MDAIRYIVDNCSAADAGVRIAPAFPMGARRFSRSLGRRHRARDQLADIASAAVLPHRQLDTGDVVAVLAAASLRSVT